MKKALVIAAILCWTLLTHHAHASDDGDGRPLTLAVFGDWPYSLDLVAAAPLHCGWIHGRTRREHPLVAPGHPKTRDQYGEGAMRGFVVAVAVLVVLVLGALEVIASRSLPVADRTPNTSASTPYNWR